MVSLTPEESRRRQELTDKLRMRVLTINEGEELRQLLERERVHATTIGDVVAALAIGFLLALVIDYLTRDR